MRVRALRGLGILVRALAVSVCLSQADALADGRATSSGVHAHLMLTPASGHTASSISARGWGFHARAMGVVVFGTRRVASFKTTWRGDFRVRFAVPAAGAGLVRVGAEQPADVTHGFGHHVTRATTRFRVLAGSAGSGLTEGRGGAGNGTATAPFGTRWIPGEHLTWFWQLQGSIDNNQAVEAYDIGGFENDASEVAALHAQGKHVICYIDVGTYEPERPDAKSFPPSVLGGNVEGWPGERWLDIRKLGELQPIMTARFEMCKAKGFDAVEPDNIDGYQNGTGFPLTAADQLAYDEWVASEVHSMGMAVFQKNDAEQAGQLEPAFDGALDEQCNQYQECSDFEAYLRAGKPVLNAEYSLSASAFCAADNAAGIMGARFDLELDGRAFEPCW